MRAGLLLLLFGAGLSAQQAGVSGITVDKSTGQPLRGVHVRFITGDFGSQGGVDVVYGAFSDATGHFAVEGMKPGLYFVMAERAGFLQLAGEGLPISTLGLKAGQRLTDYKVTMTARAVIAGRVVDEFGDPLEHVGVQIEPVLPDKQQAMVLGNANNGTTDDHGEFRLITAPGKYYLRAMMFGGDRMNGEIRTDGTPAAPFVNTYYPNAVSTTGASVVQVGAGQDLAGVEIRMARAVVERPGRSSFTVSGSVMGTPENGRAAILLRSGESAEQLNSSSTTTAAADGQFKFTGLQPGFYRVQAMYSLGNTVLQSRPLEFHLDGSDERNVQLTLLPGEELTGTLQFVGGGAMGTAEKRTVRLEMVAEYNSAGQMQPIAAQAGKDGSFRLSNVMPGKFKLTVEPMPENAYLKEVALDGKAVADGILDLSRGAAGSRLKITVSRAGGQISGKILGQDGEPAGGLLMVFLEADPKRVDDENATRVTDGKYSFRAIRPGKYRLLAIDMLQLMSTTTDGAPEDFKQFFDAADEVEIKEGDRITKDITAFTKIPEKK